MIKSSSFFSGLLVMTFLALVFSACQHDPFPIDDDGMIIIDTMENPIDTIVNPPDSMLVICDPETIYFELDIQPLLHSNCAFSGCHDAASAQDGVDLTSYERVIQTADVRPFDLGGSDLYEVITDNDPEDRMPPDPRPALTSAQINLISKWILQGAENLMCDPEATACDSLNRSFSAHIVPILQTNCQGCHSGATPSAGIDLSGYAGVAAVAGNGRLMGAITYDPAYAAMPQGGAPLTSCEITQIRTWIEEGTLNN